ncbi:hypothetical protein RhiirC2_791922 [Rhizophagus irregularis]|uniref:Uncharacterized protein n=1 Tax=Rhizophagus irregularis TaxID=588596 RepID=A0A2N1MI93_9GLOM|nr:hypothetical protein RhiirC2_791922 [Rhizophagus irregularis]
MKFIILKKIFKIKAAKVMKVVMMKVMVTKILKVYNDFSSTWFFDFQNTNSLALQEQEFHTNCHTVLNHLNSLKEIANFFNNFDSKNVIQNNETREQFELGKSALNELIQNDSLEKIYLAFQSLKLQKQNNATKNIKKNPSSSSLIPLSPNKKQSRHKINKIIL